MTGVILAAGIASRLHPFTLTRPKCLLPIGGSTLLGRTLDNLDAAGVRDVVIVTGYLEDQIRRYVGEGFSHMRVTFVTNEAFASTNNIYSLWLARDEVARAGMVLLDGDILFDHRILTALLESGFPDVLAVKSGLVLGAEEMKVKTGAGGRIVTLGKTIPPALAAGESIGIEVFSPASLPGLFAAIERKVVGEAAVNVYYEDAFQDWIDRGGTLRAVDIGDRLAIEIDTIDD
ncbi:MAG: phosphocholine cytidylyltransferase family protein, partial [Candidatus Aminicenantales bacterium]